MASRIPVPKFSPAPIDPCFCRSGRTFGRCCGSKSENRQPPGGVMVFPGHVDPDTCRKWVKRLEQQPRLRAMVNDINNPSQTVEDPTRVCDDVKPGAMRKVLFDSVVEGFQKTVAVTGRGIAWYEVPRILRYQAGGFYKRHSDSCQIDKRLKQWFKVMDRDLSCLIYLNDDFEGGGLTFTHFNYHYRPSPGDLLIFPSDNRYIHQAEKVTSGLRYVIASWAAFTQSPRVCDAPPDYAIHV